MNYGIVLKVLGSILIVESILMLPSYFIAIYTNGADKSAFLFAILLTFIIGLFLLLRKKVSNQISAKDGLAIVTLGWIVVSLLGAIPLYVAGTTNNYVDAFFEIVSGFTTTGATIFTDVEALPLGTLFWRSLTHWIGGMGILVFTLALLPALGIGGFQILKAEAPGPVAGKIAPRVRDTAKILYTTYFILTLAQVILLYLGGMSLFDSFVYTFGTVGTGGFATKNTSLGYYNSTYIHLVIAFFMIISGINFSHLHSLFKGRIKDVLKDDELRLYLGIIVVSTILIAINLFFNNFYDSMATSIRDSFFQVSSIITTTAYTTVDFDLWPSFSKGILFLLMFIGGSAGSTAGGMKIIRILVMLKLIRREISRTFHPRAILPIKINGKVMGNERVAGINSFLALYMLIFVVSSLLVTLEGIDIHSATSTVVAALSNIGTGFGFIGPAHNYAGFHQITKIFLTALMLLGRLELFTIIALIAPKNWRSEI